MANVKVAVWFWWKSGDNLATCCLQVLGQLLARVAEVPLPAVAEVHSGQNLRRATLRCIVRMTV